MSTTSDRKPYLTATVLDQDFLDEAHGNESNALEMVCEIRVPVIGDVHASDLNKYVGSQFYEALLNFPVISRTIGEWLSPSLQFSDVQIKLSNVDGRFNSALPGGADFLSWVGAPISVSLGLREEALTYKKLFEGTVHHEAGFSRDTISINLVARDTFDEANAPFPKTVLDDTSYPDIEDANANLTVPLVYGDWTVNVEAGSASVPVYCTNGNNVNVNGDTDFTVEPHFVISENANRVFDTSEVYLVRGEAITKFDAADIINVNVDKNEFEIRQSGTTPAGVTLLPDGGLYEYAQGDTIFVKVEGKDLGAYDDNIIWQARDILLTQALDILPGDLDSNWATYRDKAAPSESAISTFKSRVWIQDPQGAVEYALSMLEQVRVEMFLSRDLKLKLSSYHFDDFEASPSYEITNLDIVEDTFVPSNSDQDVNFNRAKAAYNFVGNRNEELQETEIYVNLASIAQHYEISKQVSFPNLYEKATVIDQLTEIIKMSSALVEFVDLELTWRSMLLDIGDFVKINVNIDGAVFENVPALVREIGYDPDGVKIRVKLWSFQMIEFTGYTPGYSGVVGGQFASITPE
jgi:hypothetical protein